MRTPGRKRLELFIQHRHWWDSFVASGIRHQDAIWTLRALVRYAHYTTSQRRTGSRPAAMPYLTQHRASHRMRTGREPGGDMTTPRTEDEWLSLREAADLLGMHPAT